MINLYKTFILKIWVI